AEQKIARACDVIAFQTGDESSAVAECRVNETTALVDLDRPAPALALIDKALPVLIKTYGDEHWEVGSALAQRGALHGRLGHHAAAVADLERAIAMFEQLAPEPGHLAAAKWALAR